MRKIILLGCLLAVLGLAACGEEPSVFPGKPIDAAGTEASAPEPAAPPPAAETAQPHRTEEAGGDAQTRAVSLPAIREELEALSAVVDPLPLEAEALESLYGIAPEQVLQSGSFVTMSGVFPDEVILVEAVDENAAARIAERLNARLEEFREQSKSYDPESFATAQRCGVTVDGRFVSLILSGAVDAMTEIYRAAIA